MKKQFLIALFLLLVIVFTLKLHAQPQMQWHLNITNIDTQGIQMQLRAYNAGTSAWSYTFPNANWCSFLIDGVPPGHFLIPMVLPLTIEPNQDLYETMYYSFSESGYLADGSHSLQAVLLYGTPVPVGSPCTFHTPVNHAGIDIGAGDLFARVPLDFYWRNNLYQCILSAQDFDYHGGRLEAISFYSHFSVFENAPWPVRIFIKHTTANDLADGWVPVSEEDEVFNGIKNFAIGEDREQKFWLQEPFYYDGVSNLALLVQRVWAPSYYVSSEMFKAQECAPNQARMAVSDAVYYDPYALPAAENAQLIAKMPKMSFYFDAQSVDIAADFLAPALQQEMLNVYPNPFRETVNLEIKLEKDAPVSLEIYNLRGQKLSTIVSENLAKGKHNFVWNATGILGQKMPAGIYYCRLKTGDKIVELKKIIRF